LPSPPESGSRHARWTDIDWARGLAVLIMIHAHVLDGWTSLSEQASPLFRKLEIINGFAAPLFLWLAGVALVLSGERAARETGSRLTAWRSLVCRGLEVFILAFLFRLQSFLFNPGSEPVAIFRVDILNIMGPAIAVAAVMWGFARCRSTQVVSLATAALLVALVTPMVATAAWVDALPTWFQWHLRPAGEHTVFTLFPWAGFTFGGAAAGCVLAFGHESRSLNRVQTGLAVTGLGLVVLGLYAASLPSIYRHSLFWTTSPTFFAIRVGVLMVTCGVLYALAVGARAWRIPCRPLQRLGRSSLFVYWIHVQVVYGWVTWPLHHRLTVQQALGAVVLVSLAMYALLDLRDRLVVWSGRTAEGKVAAGEVAAV
jgi:uncharacterized membrane protein